MSQFVFDERAAQQLEVMYRTRDVLRRRRLVREAVAVESGHRVLDVGCGPGFYAAEFLADVGANALGDASFLEGSATSLPLEGRAFDRALCVRC